MRGMFAGIAVAVASLSAAFAQNHPIGQKTPEVHQAGPTQAKTILDNSAVSVIRIRMAPHEKTPMHDVTARVVVWLTDAHLRETLSTGKLHYDNAKAGDVEWVPAERHQGENLTDHPIEFIAIVPKQAAQ
jgi:quercetin dioxygenase-like cupin family protein